jgi:imidazoleglycerol phosphate synthase cyclase subunit
MLAKRIIPCLDVDNVGGRGRVVKGVKFFDHVDAGDPVEQAEFYDREKADELVFYDITASHEGRGIMAEVVRAVADRVFMPITVGGGIRTQDDATRLIQAGAEKVSVNSAAVMRPELIREISHKFGRCATVVGIDANRVEQSDPIWATEQDRAAGRPVRAMRIENDVGSICERRAEGNRSRCALVGEGSGAAGGGRDRAECDECRRNQGGL